MRLRPPREDMIALFYSAGLCAMILIFTLPDVHANPLGLSHGTFSALGWIALISRVAVYYLGGG